jgi:ribosomal-protein-alanine N-acetyltransferase
MDEEDLPWVLQTEQSAYRFPWSMKGFESSLRQGINFVFCNAVESPVGYACLLPIVDELELLNFCVAPDYQGQGIGKKALLHLLARFEGSHYQAVFLEVRRSHSAAQKLYQGAGFEAVGTRPNYYRTETGKEDAILMKFDLSR